VELINGSDGNLYGQADWDVHHIKLWPDNLNSPDHAVGIVLHECLHVIFDNYEMGKKLNRREEILIEGFEKGLVSLFRDNPKLMTWMKKWLRG
jgi:hypothetical protein